MAHFKRPQRPGWHYKESVYTSQPRCGDCWRPSRGPRPPPGAPLPGLTPSPAPPASSPPAARCWTAGWPPGRWGDSQRSPVEINLRVSSPGVAAGLSWPAGGPGKTWDRCGDWRPPTNFFITHHDPSTASSILIVQTNTQYWSSN